MSIIDHFEYGTWEMQETKRGTCKRVGYRYGHLALLRVDYYCNDCNKKHECWAVANLAAAAYMFPGAIFRNVDSGVKYIYEISPLAKWDVASTDDIRKCSQALIKTCINNDGIPTTLVALFQDGPEAAAGDIPPGTIAGLNGYTKQ